MVYEVPHDLTYALSQYISQHYLPLTLCSHKHKLLYCSVHKEGFLFSVHVLSLLGMSHPSLLLRFGREVIPCETSLIYPLFYLLPGWLVQFSTLWYPRSSALVELSTLRSDGLVMNWNPPPNRELLQGEDEFSSILRFPVPCTINQG